MFAKDQNSTEHPVTLIRGARQLLTLRGAAGPRRGAALSDLGIIPDGAVLIRDGKILEVSPSRRADNLLLSRGAREINAAGRVVMPGFVDSQIQPSFAPALAARALALRVRNLLAGLARHGTTTVAAGASPQPDRPDAWKLLRTLAEFDGSPLGIVPVCYADSETMCDDVLPVVARRKLARIVSVGAEAMESAAARRLLGCARRLRFGVALRAGVDPEAARLAVEMEAASVSLAELAPATAGDLASSGTVAVLFPSARPAFARALIDAGAAIALASGFGGDRCPTYNMQMIVSLACSQMGLSPAEAICAATVNAAYALALGHRCGSVEPGKAADLLLLNVPDYRDIPEQVGINHVHMVLKDGEIIYQEGEVTGWTSK